MNEPEFPKPSQTLPIWSWLLFALTTRILASVTHSHWFHPDEWCQTFEPANIIAHGFGVHSQEIGLHLRNLTWPTLLAGVLKVTHSLSPSSIDLRVFGTNLLSGLLDLLILWGWIQLLKKDPIARTLSTRAKNWSLALLLLPWFTIYEAVSPRAEHLSEIAFWAALGCIVNGYWLLGGFASIAIAAFRYPSILLSATIFCFVLFKSRATFVRFLAGATIGTIAFGAADMVIYGRPWESFWMYLQYNIFTGSGTQVFGKKGIEEYLEVFSWNWRTYPILLPLGFTLLMSSFYGFWRGMRQTQLWALCLLVYMIGHLLVPHKEGRFMIPIETLLMWAAFLGASMFQWRWRKLLWSSLILSVIANCFIFLHALRADLWKEHGTYRELGSHLKSTPGVCAVLAAGEISSIMMPFDEPTSAPSPAFGSLSLELDRRGYTEMHNSEIIWFEHAPRCSPNSSVNRNSDPNTRQRILLHTHRLHAGWTDEGCTLLPSGLLRHFPKFTQDWILQQGYKSSSWYDCPTSILNYFGKQRIHQIYSNKFNRIKSLPGLGTTARELEDLGHQTSPPPHDIFLPTLDNPSARPI
ncbi:MAG: hypothetical protein ABIQ95_03110 [Bdellovibrionia bacterium]